MKRAVVISTILCSGLLIGGNVDRIIYAQDIKLNNAVLEVKSLTQDEALSMLFEHSNKVNYIYQGDENLFEVLKEKGLNGYVFLPDIPTDMGYFIDKNDHNVYYFHPSGYLELIK